MQVQSGSARLASQPICRCLEVSAACILDRSPLSPPLRKQALSADRETRMMCQGAPAAPLEDDDILPTILLRLPPLPSSLPRVSAVCKRWRRLVTDPYFHRRFLAHHKKAPLLGFFLMSNDNGRIDFVPALDPPNRILPARLSSRPLGPDHIILACHHGRLLVHNYRDDNFVVWEPVTGDHRHVDTPQTFKEMEVAVLNGAVVCASQERGHVHGACHAEPFQVVLIGSNSRGVFASVYSSEAGGSGTWGSLISLSRPFRDITLHPTVPPDCQSSLVGNSIYWLPMGVRAAALKFDLHTQTLAVIDAPPGAFSFDDASILHGEQSLIVPADGGGGLSFIVLSGFSVHVWKRRISNGHHGVARWVLKNTVELGNHLSLEPRVDRMNIHGALRIVGLDEHDNVIFRMRDNGDIYIVHLETLQFKEIPLKMGGHPAHPFSSFYTAGNK